MWFNGRRITRTICILPIISLWLYAASLPFQSMLIDEHVFKTKRTNINWQDWPHDNTANIINNNIYTSKLSFVKAKELNLNAFEYAVKMRPFDVRHWLKLSDIYISYGLLEKSKRALAFVEKLAWNHPHYLIPLLAAHLYHDEKLAIYRVARRIIEIAPKYSYLLYVALTVEMNDSEYFKNILFSDETKDYANTKKALTNVLKKINTEAFHNKTNKNEKVISVVWEHADVEIKEWLLQTRLVDLPLQHIQAFAKLNAFSKGLNDSIIYEGGNLTLGFGKGGLDNAFCWQNKHKPIKSLYAEELRQDDSLQLVFKAKDPTRIDYVVSCYLPVKLITEKTVTLTGAWSGENAGSKNRPVNFSASIYDKKTKKMSIKQYGDWHNKPIEMKFQLKPTTVGIRFYYRIINKFEFRHEYVKLMIRQLTLMEE